VLEDPADRQVGQQAHREHHPEGDLVGQDAIARVDPAGRRQRLSEAVGADNLFEPRQAIQDPARVIGRQRALSSWHASRSLLVASVLSKPKVTGGCDLRPFERYWAKLISDSAKPFGALAVLDRRAEEELMAGRAVTGIAGRRAARLLPWGVRTCLDLARADRRLVRELLTATGEALWWELNGDPVQPIRLMRGRWWRA